MGREFGDWGTRAEYYLAHLALQRVASWAEGREADKVCPVIPARKGVFPGECGISSLIFQDLHRSLLVWFWFFFFSFCHICWHFLHWWCGWGNDLLHLFLRFIPESLLLKTLHLPTHAFTGDPRKCQHRKIAVLLFIIIIINKHRRRRPVRQGQHFSAVSARQKSTVGTAGFLRIFVVVCLAMWNCIWLGDSERG